MGPKAKKFFKKNYSKRNKPKLKKKEFGQPKNKFKHIARNQQSEQVLKRMRDAELKREARTQRMDEDDRPSGEESENETNDYDELLQLVSTKNLKDSKNAAIESSDESSEEEQSPEETEDEIQQESSENESDTEMEQLSDNNVPAEDVETDVESEQDDQNEPEITETSLAQLSDEENKPESEESDESDSEIETCDKKSQTKKVDDPFSIHLDNDLSSELLDAVSGTNKCVKKEIVSWNCLGKLLFEIPEEKQGTQLKPKGLICLDEDESYAEPGTIPRPQYGKHKFHIKNQIWKHLLKANAPYITDEKNQVLNDFQAELFSIINNYQDLYFPKRNFDNAEELRLVYSLHVLNHAMKTRARILHHNAKINKNKGSADTFPEYYRDQGLARPKVLIVLPFRDSAYKVVNNLIALFCGGDKTKVMNHARFLREFTGEELFFPKRNPKPEDYEKIFAGNVNDNFRLGLCLTKRNIKLYTDFYNSDIIIASPLGLRMIIGAAGEKDRDFDFLSSIEILILDQAELFYAQNWEHLLHVFEHLHLKPEKMRDTDFSRVRSWILNGLSKYYCQTLLFTSHELPEFKSLYNHHFHNYRGKVRTMNTIEIGSIRHVAVNVPQRIEAASIEESYDARFNYFTKSVLPQYKSPTMAHCLIYVPSYFDYIRIRNYFKKEEMSFVQISEYSKDEKIARARDMFFHSSAHFLLYSERAHFFKRTRLKGIRNMIMYGPPSWPHFYPEMINLMHENCQNPRDGCEDSMSVTLLYTKFDLIQVSAIVGSERAAKMAKASKGMHMFMND